MRNRQAFLAKHYKGKPHGPKAPPDMAPHELDAIREAATKAESEPTKASSRSNRKLKAEAGGGPITERLRLQIPVAMEAVRPLRLCVSTRSVLRMERDSI